MLSIFLCVVMLLSNVPLSAFAAEGDYHTEHTADCGVAYTQSGGSEDQVVTYADAASTFVKVHSL